MAKHYKTIEIINEIIDLVLVHQKSRKSIVDHLNEKYGYKVSYSYTLIKKANVKITKLYKDKHKEAAMIAKGQLEEMLEYAIRNKDIKLALSIRKELNTLMGLYEAQKMDLTSGGEKITGININIVRPNDD